MSGSSFAGSARSTVRRRVPKGTAGLTARSPQSSCAVNAAVQSDTRRWRPLLQHRRLAPSGFDATRRNGPPSMRRKTMSIALTRLTPLAIVVGLWTVALATPSLAADLPCAADVQKFCASVERGGGRIVKCLKDHQAELSSGCKASIASRAQNQPPKACAADIEKFCKGVTPGGGALATCLKKHEGDLSSQCKKERAANRTKEKSASAPQPTAAAKP